MHEADLREMKRRIDAIWSSLSTKEQISLLKRHDVLATRGERTDPRDTAKAISDFDKELEHLGDMSEAVTIRMIDAFEEEYDHDTVENLHGNEVKEYKERLTQYNLLKKHLEKLRRS